MNLGSDIRIKGAFFTHFKTLKLAKKAGWESVFRLQQLWFFASENRTDGNLLGMDDDDIALAAGWTHETRTLIDALIVSGWLDGEANNRVLHDYEEHQPWVQERVLRQQHGKKGGQIAAEHMTKEQTQERARNAANARYNKDKTPHCDDELCLGDAKDTKQGLASSKHNDAKPIPIQSNPDQPKPLPVSKAPLDSMSRAESPQTGDEQSEPETGKKKKPVEVKEVGPKLDLFNFWKQIMGKGPLTKLYKSSLRDRRIDQALNQYSVEQLKQAIIGCASHPHNMGDNETGTKYNDLDLILRDEVHIDRFIELAKDAVTSVDSETGHVCVQVNGRRAVMVQPKVRAPGCDQYGIEYGAVTLARKWGLSEEDIANAE